MATAPFSSVSRLLPLFPPPPAPQARTPRVVLGPLATRVVLGSIPQATQVSHATRGDGRAAAAEATPADSSRGRGLKEGGPPPMPRGPAAAASGANNPAITPAATG
jgi:hypothetical protein